MPAKWAKRAHAPIVPPSGGTCKSCPLGGCSAYTGTPPGSGFLKPYGQMRSGVMLVAEALADAGEVRVERALVGAGGALLGRACSRKQWKVSEMFRCVTTLFCMPSAKLRAKNGWLQPWAEQALAHCAPNLEGEIALQKPKVIVALGETAFQVLTGETLPLMAARGYVFRERGDRCWVIPTFHPEWLTKGQQALTQVMSWDLARAVQIAAEGYTPLTLDYVLDPPYEEWSAYVAEFLRDPSRTLAVDIETQWSGSRAPEADDDDDELIPDETYNIERFSCAFELSRGASVPFIMPYLPGITQMLQAANHTVIWNRPFDRPRLMKALEIDMPLERVSDAMDGWHCAFNALPRKLGFATACLPSSLGIAAWKHLSNSEPARYSALDSIALLRNWQDIDTILKATGAHGVYKSVCLDLDPSLELMSQKGLLIDQQAKDRLEAELAERLDALTREMDALVPDEVKSPHIWTTEANAVKGKQTFIERLRRQGDASWEMVSKAPIYAIPAQRKARRCAACGALDVTKVHVTRKTLKVEKEAVC